jgi:hypothetical protein
MDPAKNTSQSHMVFAVAQMYLADFAAVNTALLRGSPLLEMILLSFNCLIICSSIPFKFSSYFASL